MKQTSLFSEDADVHAKKDCNPKAHLENQILTRADEGETGLKEVEEENKKPSYEMNRSAELELKRKLEPS